MAAVLNIGVNVVTTLAFDTIRILISSWYCELESEYWIFLEYCVFYYIYFFLLKYSIVVLRLEILAINLVYIEWILFLVWL